MNLDRAIDMFLASKATRRPSTQRQHIGTLDQYRAHLEAEGLQPWPITPEAVESFIQALQRRGLKPNTVSFYYRSLRTFCNWLVNRGHIERSPIKAIDKPPQQKLLPRAVEESSITKLLDFIPRYVEPDPANQREWIKTRDYALIVLALDTGLRIGEMAQLTLQDIDLTHGRYTVTIRGSTKTHQQRTAVFWEQAAKAVQAWLDVRAELGVPDSVDALFVARPAGGFSPLTPSGIYQMFRKWQERAGMEPHPFHALRHSCAVFSLRAGIDIADISQQLGHQSIHTTAIYLRVDEQGRRERFAGRNPLSYLGGAAT